MGGIKKRQKRREREREEGWQKLTVGSFAEIDDARMGGGVRGKGEGWRE